jgi:hypothetical protein
MRQDGYLGDAALNRQGQVDPDRLVASTRVRDITPADGSIVRSGELVSVFCAECQRWIDCHASITPEIALERHRYLIH